MGMAKELTKGEISAFINKGKRKLYRDGGAKGLYLSTTANGTASWVYRYRQDGQLHEHGLGSYDKKEKLDDVRDRAYQALKLVKAGKSPIVEKQDAVLARQRTFEVVAREFLPIKQSKLKNPKHAAQWESSLKTYAFPKIGSIPINEIKAVHIGKMLSPIWHDINETAQRVRQRVEAVIGYAIANDYREDSHNPAAWKNNIEHLMAEAEAKDGHHAALTYEEIPVFLQRLGQQSGTGARALEIALLTCTRTQEVLGAQWDEIDFKNKSWTIPWQRVKGMERKSPEKRRDHRVPLTPQVIKLFRTLDDEHPKYVFPSPYKDQPISNGTMLAVVKRMGMKGDCTPHGMRASYRTWTQDETEYEHDVCEMVLAHDLKHSDSVKAYARGDLYKKRISLMKDWADFAASKISI